MFYIFNFQLLDIRCAVRGTRYAASAALRLCAVTPSNQ